MNQIELNELINNERMTFDEKMGELKVALKIAKDKNEMIYVNWAKAAIKRLKNITKGGGR